MNKKSHKVQQVVALLPGLLVCMLGCSVNTSDEGGNLRMTSVAEMNDTIGPHEPVRIQFSEPLDDSAVVEFEFSPAFLDYFTVLNADGDTLTIIHTVPFPGDSRMVIRTRTPLASQRGTLMEPGQDSVVFMTYPAEQEPNDDEATADTMAGVIFGSLPNVNDTDWYAASDTTIRMMTIESTGLEADCVVFDAAGMIWRGSGSGVVDTISFGTPVAAPLHIRVSSRGRSSGGYYRFEAIAGN